jgi:hypothetical protein
VDPARKPDLVFGLRPVIISERELPANLFVLLKWMCFIVVGGGGHLNPWRPLVSSLATKLVAARSHLWIRNQILMAAQKVELMGMELRNQSKSVLLDIAKKFKQKSTTLG